MSSNAALSAARRRRGAAAAAAQPLPPGSRTPQPASAPPPREPTTPNQLLVQHDMRLHQLEMMQRQKVENNISGDSGIDWNGILKDMDTRINKIEKVPKEKDSSKDLQKQIKELKLLIGKVQTFAMETNLTLSQYKMEMALAMKELQKNQKSTVDENIGTRSTEGSIESASDEDEEDEEEGVEEDEDEENSGNIIRKEVEAALEN